MALFSAFFPSTRRIDRPFKRSLFNSSESESLSGGSDVSCTSSMRASSMSESPVTSHRSKAEVSTPRISFGGGGDSGNMSRARSNASAIHECKRRSSSNETHDEHREQMQEQRADAAGIPLTHYSRERHGESNKILEFKFQIVIPPILRPPPLPPPPLPPTAHLLATRAQTPVPDWHITTSPCAFEFPHGRIGAVCL